MPSTYAVNPKIPFSFAILIRYLSKKVPTPSPQSLNTLKITTLRKLAIRHNVKGTDGLKRANLLEKLKKEFKPVTRKNIGTVKFEEATPTPAPTPRPTPTPTPKPAPKPKPAPVKGKTLAELRAYARDRCLKGRSRYPLKANLQKFIATSNRSPRPLLNRNSVSKMKAQELRDYARDRCVRGYSKYPKKSNLLRFLVNKAVK